MNDRGFARAAGVVLVLLLVLGAVGLWWFRGSLGARDEASAEISEASAAIAEAKLLQLRDRQEPISLSEVELSSLMRYRAPLWAINLVDEPYVELSGDTLHLVGTVATDNVPSHPELDRVRPILPDSSKVAVTGHLRALSDGRAALEIHQVDFANIPIPNRYYPVFLDRMGRTDEPGLSPTAVALSLPAGARTARVENGHLLLFP